MVRLTLLVLFFLVPIIRDIHFYLTHRLLHTKFFYKIAHKVHHHNVNPGPWSGLAMHPVEHVIYFSGILIHWIIPSHPLIALWHIFHAGIAPHAGHSGFDKIVFIPANKSPNKKVKTETQCRLEMLKLAIKGNPNFEISDLEIHRGGISYTIDTLEEYEKQVSNQNNEISYLIGSDSLLDFKNWKQPKEIIKKCQVIVAIRPGFRPSDIPSWLLHGIRFANIPRFEISSSNIRRRWIENKTIRYMVTLPVWEYINRHNLYH